MPGTRPWYEPTSAGPGSVARAAQADATTPAAAPLGREAAPGSRRDTVDPPQRGRRPRSLQQAARRSWRYAAAPTTRTGGTAAPPRRLGRRTRLPRYRSRTGPPARSGPNAGFGRSPRPEPSSSPRFRPPRIGGTGWPAHGLGR